MITTTADTVLLTQASDGADYLGLINDREFDYVLKLNILFFDRIALGSPDLLGNRRLLQLLETERESMEKLFSCGSNGDAIICPSVWFENQSLIEVAENMISAHTIHSLRSDEALRGFANALDTFKPRLLPSNQSEYRECSLSSAKELLHHTITQQDPSLKATLPSKAAAERAIEWFSRLEHASNFHLSAFHRFVDAELETDSQKLKQVAEAAAQHAKALTINSELSVPQQIMPLITTLKRAVNFEASDSKPMLEDIETTFPIASVLSLSLGDVLKLRESGGIAAVRSQLSLFRQGHALDMERLQHTLNRCADEVIFYAHARPSDRAHFLKMKAAARRCLRLRLVFDLVSFSTPLILKFFYGSNISVPLFAAVQAGLFAAKLRYNSIADSVSGANVALPARANPSDLKYKPEQGNVLLPQ